MLCIVNYGSGNISAISNICRREKISHMIVDKPRDLAQGSHFLLPGVGAFDPTMETLQSSGLLAGLEEQVCELGKPIMGICVGMHLLADSSEEGSLPGLGWIPGKVKRIDTRTLNQFPHSPHMGWNSVDIVREHEVLKGIDAELGYYFLHGYYFDAENSTDVLATVTFGGQLPCLVQKSNVIGAQFHPEKSHLNGICLLNNFARLTS